MYFNNIYRELRLDDQKHTKKFNGFLFLIFRNIERNIKIVELTRAGY